MYIRMPCENWLVIGREGWKAVCRASPVSSGWKQGTFCFDASELEVEIHTELYKPSFTLMRSSFLSERYCLYLFATHYKCSLSFLMFFIFSVTKPWSFPASFETKKDFKEPDATPGDIQIQHLVSFGTSRCFGSVFSIIVKYSKEMRTSHDRQ